MHALLLQSDIFERLGGFSDTHTLDGLGSFRGVLKRNIDLNLLVYMILWDFLGPVNSEPYSELTSGQFYGEVDSLNNLAA